MKGQFTPTLWQRLGLVTAYENALKGQLTSKPLENKIITKNNDK